MSTLADRYAAQDRAKAAELIGRYSLDVTVQKLAEECADAWLDYEYDEQYPSGYRQALIPAIRFLLMDGKPLREALYVVVSELTLDAWNMGDFS